MRQRPFRPGFDHTVEAPPRAVGRAVEARMRAGTEYVGRSATDHLMLTVPEAARHFWSPYLHLEIVAHRSEAGRETPTRAYVRGFFTPAPGLWSSFIFAYLTCGTLFFFSGVWALTQLQLDQRPDALWLCGLFALGALGLYLISRVGRRLAAEQMDALHGAVSETLAGVGVLTAGAGPEPAPAAPVGG